MDEKCILIADTPEGAKMIKNILGNEIRFIVSNSMEEAATFLSPNISMIICGDKFDECRMFDFLRIAKANPAFRNIPFLCFRGLHKSLGLTIFESLHIACKALGALDFIDLYQLKTELGVVQAEAKFKEIVFNATSINSTEL